MKPKYAFMSLFVILALVVAVVASSQAQDYGRSRNVLPDTLPSDSVRPADPLFRAPKDSDLKPMTDDIHKPFASVKTTDALPRKIGAEEAALIRKIGAEEAKLVLQTDDLIRQLETAEAEDQLTDAKAKLSDHLGKWFDVRQKRQEREIEALEAQVKTLKKLARKRQENREEIISHKLDQIIRDSLGLGF
ncbi:hypothetical protein [Singulisphaera acidiphila]|uniref:Uncharacterized protein n=1 Tax=Singulisphaera acidiphila (strain ATCC BAA-1392 / DSM 18658 / VKM B-2454 / MOB10) TaxID=886293 RepID=L0DE22_SINAD|nr:hypothetical protein [Singulisphaera acidiphila]AGA27497.1 hypothetical protein Sinac_3225 [Singulisphaera acidiphila DSM 18658]